MSHAQVIFPCLKGEPAKLDLVRMQTRGPGEVCNARVVG